MTDYEFPEAAEVEKAYRAAHRALEGILHPGNFAFAPEADLPVPEVLSQFPALVREAEVVAAGVLGPGIGWKGPHREGDWEPVIAGLDMDGGGHDFGADLAPSTDVPWEDTSMYYAECAYRRECGWDFPPGEAGLWLLMLAPTSAVGGSGPWFYSGNLAGFVVLYDRDEDGTYESAGHVWTARAWRRQGIARRLLAEARSRFGFSDFEGPLTDDGAGLVAAWQSPG